MCLLLETIKFENGKPENISYHDVRFNHAREQLFGVAPIFLENEITVPDFATQGLFRCRITYRANIEEVEFIPQQSRKINSLMIVHDNTIEYPYKYADRSHLKKLYDQRKNCDEIIIIKNGMVTDCFIGNLVFFDGQKWHTPKHPLLKGTQRQYLIDNKQIFESSITENNIKNYQMVGIINVFYSINNMPTIKTSAIKY